jgi:hypothetical protein
MQIIRDLASTVDITDPGIRHLVALRMHELDKEPFDLSELGYFLIVQPGDSLDVIDRQLCFPILCNRFTGIRFGQSGFTPSFEFVEEFSGCYEMVFIMDDSGFGIEVFIPKSADIPDLLLMCQRYASPGSF